MDPAKLKVVELRSELAARGLDTKGNKAVLVERLKEALEKDQAQGEAPVEKSESPPVEEEEDIKTEEAEPTDEKMEQEEVAPVKCEKPVETKTEVAADQETKPEPAEVKMDQEEVKCEKSDEVKQEMKSDPAEEMDEDAEESKDESNKEDETKDVSTNEDSKKDESKRSEESSEKRGEKRKHSPSPSRGTRRRSHSPVKEDEPVIDVDKVLLNWYDSDLQLQIDRENFTTAKPYVEGAFGYVWAGVRATHGVDSGKACFEVKITEELTWEDVIKTPARNRRDKDKDSRRKPERNSSRHDDKDRSKERKKDESEQNGEDNKNEGENSEKKASETEKMDVDAAKDDENKDEVKTEESDVKQKESDDKKSESEDKESEIKKDESEEKKDESEETKDESEEKKDKSEDKKEESEDKKDEGKKTETESEEKEPEPITPHLIRIGWSVVSSGLQLGEEKHSYGYESSGNLFNDKEFTKYGIVFTAGDVVSSYVNFDEKEIVISFAVNGVSQSTAVTISREDLPEGFALFPHILTKNCAFEINLGNKEEPFFANPEEFKDYVFLDKVEDMIAGPMRPEKRADCEVIMMVGLPASGKTYWVQKHIEENPDKRYTVIGNTQLLQKMTVNAQPLKNSFKSRWNMVLDKLQQCINKLSYVAARRRRNYIFDQTNVFPAAQRRKMRSFEGFKRRAVVVVVGDEEQTKRQQAKEAQDGKDVPGSALLQMKANMSLPRTSDWLEEVTFAELAEAEAKAAVQKYNTQGKEAGFSMNSNSNWKRSRDNRGPPRWHDNRRDYHHRGGYRDNRGYNGRYDPRGGRSGGGWQPRSSGWRNDRRDNRGPPVRYWQNNNRGGSGGGGRGRDFDRGVRDGRISRPQRGNSYNGNRNNHQGGGGRPMPSPWQQGWSQQNSNWTQNPPYKRYY